MTTLTSFQPKRTSRTSDNQLLLAQIVGSLQKSGYSALKNIECRVDQGTVELHGAVPTFFLKQMAQAVALRCDGVSRIENCLLVE